MNAGLALALAAALGTGATAAWGLLALGDLAARWGRFRATSVQMYFRAVEEKPFTEEDLYGLSGVPWELWQLAGAAAGVFLAYLLLGERNPALAVLGLGGVFAPRAVRGVLVRRAEARIARQSREFIFLLRSGMAMRGGLRPALEDVAGRLGKGVVGDRLKYHLDRALSPEQALERLAGDLRSREMQDLLLGVRAARAGGMSYEEAVVRAAEEATERMREEARAAIEEAPVRLLIPMLLLLFPPILVLTMYPLLARVLAVLSTPGAPAPW